MKSIQARITQWFITQWFITLSSDKKISSVSNLHNANSLSPKRFDTYLRNEVLYGGRYIYNHKYIYIYLYDTIYLLDYVVDFMVSN